MYIILELLLEIVRIVNSIGLLIAAVSKRNFDYGLFVASLALLVTVYESFIQRQHNKLSVRPALRIDTVISTSKSHAALINAGTGPAIIKSFRVFVKKKGPNAKEVEFDGSQNGWGIPVTKYMKEQGMLPANEEVNFNTLAIFQDDVLGPNDKFILLNYAADDNKNIEAADVLGNTLLHFIRFEVRYTSIYKDDFKCKN